MTTAGTVTIRYLGDRLTAVQLGRLYDIAEKVGGQPAWDDESMQVADVTPYEARRIATMIGQGFSEDELHDAGISVVVDVPGRPTQVMIWHEEGGRRCGA